MSVGGNVIQGVSSLLKGFAANAAGKAQFRALNQKADATRVEASLASQLELERGNRQSADLIVAAAKGGGGMTGSPLNVLKDLERQIAFQAINTVISGENQARVYNHQARVAKKQGKIDFWGGVMDAGASFLNAADQAKAGKS